MQPTGNIGVANDVRAQERVALVERRLADVFPGAGRPHFWPDADVRRFLIAQHGFLTLDCARAELARLFGQERTPPRSTIGRFWQRLDAMDRRK